MLDPACGAFTSERLLALELLATQAAISLETARSYLEPKRAEEALRDREELLWLAIEATELGTYDYYPVSGKIVSSTRNLEMFDLAHDAQYDFGLLLSHVHPEDPQRVDQLVQQAIDPNASGNYDAEYRSLWPDGTLRWIKAKGRVFFGDMGGVRRASLRSKWCRNIRKFPRSPSTGIRCCRFWST